MFRDNGGEFVKKAFSECLDTSGIEWKSTVPHSSEQKKIVERIHLTLLYSAQTMLQHDKLPKMFGDLQF